MDEVLRDRNKAQVDIKGICAIDLRSVSKGVEIEIYTWTNRSWTSSIRQGNTSVFKEIRDPDAIVSALLNTANIDTPGHKE
jgi:hypothetical protein